MKKYTLIFSLLLVIVYLQAQDYKISYTGTGASSIIDTVIIENLTQGTSTIIGGSDLLHLVAASTGLNPISETLKSLRIYPNPTTESSTIEFVATVSGSASLELFDITGKRVVSVQNTLTIGIHSFKVSGLSNGIYTLRINSQAYTYTGKLVSNSTAKSGVKISYLGNSEIPVTTKKLKSGSIEKAMQYTTGDRLKYTGRSGKYSTIVTDIPTRTKTINFNFIACSDADGNNYPVVQIGTQIWMAENLKTTKYRNGDPVALVTDANTWLSNEYGAYCNYENSLSNIEHYGQLYNWYAVNDSRDITPIGWKMPSYDESVAMAKSLVGDRAVGGKLKETGTSHWLAPNAGAINSTGFTARPGGIRFNDGAFYSKGTNGYWWCPSSQDSVSSFGFALRSDIDSLKFYIGLKNYGFSVRCIADDSETTKINSMEIGNKIDVITTTIPSSGGNINVSKNGSLVDGLKITIPANSFPSDKTFNVSYSEIKTHEFGNSFNPISPLVSVTYDGVYADELITVEVPVKIPEGHFAMGFLYNEETGELEGMPLQAINKNSVVVATRHFATSAFNGSGTKSMFKGQTQRQEPKNTGYFVISSISIEQLKKQKDIVSEFEPGDDDWEFTNYGSFVSPSGICSGMCLTAMWYYMQEAANGNTKLFHKYDKYTIANYTNLWQDNTLGIKFSSMAHQDYENNNKTYEIAIDNLAMDKTKDSLSWYSFAYSILQTKQPQFVGIMSSAGGGHVLIANDVWMKDGKLWISDPNHPGNKTLNVQYTNNEFEPYYASLNAAENPFNFEYIAYYGKTAIVDWNLLSQRWTELNEGTIGNGVFPEKKLWVRDPTGNTTGWELTDEFITDMGTLNLEIKNNFNVNYKFAIFDSEGYQILPNPKSKFPWTYDGEIYLKPGLNIIGYCIYSKSYNSEGEESWDWADFKWVDIYYNKLKIIPDPVISGRLDKEIEMTASTGGTAPIEAKYVWDFGDGSPEVIMYNDTVVKHTFTKAGDFDVVVTQYNNLTGKKTVTATTKAKIGYQGFNFGIVGIRLKKTCTAADGSISYEEPGYEDELIFTQLDPKPVITQDGNTITATWDGIYTYHDWFSDYLYPRKGNATFIFGSNDSLQYSFYEEFPGTPGSFYSSIKLSITGILPGIDSSNFVGDVTGIKTISQVVAYPNGKNCETTGFDYYLAPGQVDKYLRVYFYFKTK